MDNRNGTPNAVITGDLIDSQQFSPEAVTAALDCIRSVVDDYHSSFFDLDPKFTRFRGDGWQFILGDAPRALRLAVQIQASLRGTANLPTTRVAIGVGAIQSMGGASLADAAGEAFVISGRTLDWLESRGGTLAISGPGITHLHQIAVEFLELRLRLWTQPQAEAAALFLHSPESTGRDIASRLGITQQAVSYRLAGADTRRISALLREWESEFELSPGDHRLG